MPKPSTLRYRGPENNKIRRRQTGKDTPVDKDKLLTLEELRILNRFILDGHRPNIDFIIFINAFENAVKKHYVQNKRRNTSQDLRQICNILNSEIAINKRLQKSLASLRLPIELTSAHILGLFERFGLNLE